MSKMQKNKFAKKVTMKYLEQQLKDMPEEKRKEFLEITKENLFKEKQTPTDETKEQLSQSFYIAKGRTYTSAMSLIENFDCVDMFKEVLFSKLTKDGLFVCFDDTLTEDVAVYIVYRHNNDYRFDYIVNGKANQKIIIDKDMFYFTDSNYKEMSQEETNQFLKELLEYNKIDYLFEVDTNLMEYNNQPDKKMISNAKSMKFWACFWEWGVLGIAILISFIFYIISTQISSLNKYIGYFVLIPVAISFVAMGIDSIVGALFKMPHILLIEQSKQHKKMDPDHLDWTSFSKKEYIFIGIICIIAGIALIIISILFI